MPGEGFIQQMIDSAKRNREKLGRHRKEKRTPQTDYVDFNPENLKKVVSEEVLQRVKKRAVRLRRIETLKSIVKTFVTIFVLIFILYFLYVSFLSNR